MIYSHPFQDPATTTATTTNDSSSRTTALDIEAVIDHLKVMRYQEEMYYRRNNDNPSSSNDKILSSLGGNKRKRSDNREEEVAKKSCPTTTATTTPPKGEKKQEELNKSNELSDNNTKVEDWRWKICEWCYNFVDCCDLSRKCVSIAFSYLDRYLCTKEGKNALGTNNEYMLATATALYIAIKIHGETKIHTSVIAALSNGKFTNKRIEDMEKSILSALQWKLSEPTTFDFIHYFMALIPNCVTAKKRNYIMQEASYIAETAVMQISFMDRLPSEIAIKCIMKVIWGLNYYDENSLKTIQCFLRDIDQHTGPRVQNSIRKIQDALDLLSIGMNPTTLVDHHVVLGAVVHNNDSKDHEPYPQSPIEVTVTNVW